MSVSFRRRVRSLTFRCAQWHPVTASMIHYYRPLVPFFSILLGCLLALRKEMMTFGTRSVPYRVDCVCRTRQSYDRHTHGRWPRKASLVLLSPHIAPLITRSPQPCSIRLAHLSLRSMATSRSHVLLQKGRTLSTHASKISTASPLLLCTLSTCHSPTYRNIYPGELTFSLARRCSPLPSFLITKLIVVCACSGRSYVKYACTAPT